MNIIGKYVFVVINIFALTYCFLSNAQSFVKVVPEQPIGVYNSSCPWFDFDNDGDLDFIIAGQSSTNQMHTLIYENRGANVFRPASHPFNVLPQYGELKVSLFNLNYDDRIDIVMAGRIIGIVPNRLSMLHNTETGFFEQNTIVDFVNRDGNPLITSGDVNHDGRSDLFISCIIDYTPDPILKAGLYENKGSFFLENQQLDFLDLYIGDSKLIDIDNDSDLDLIISGSDNDFPQYQQAEVYLNDGLGNFIKDTRQSLKKLQNGTLSFADIDNDSYVDLLMTGYDEFLVPTTKLYKNNGAGIFQEIQAIGLPGFVYGSTQWGDFDNDGDMDLLMMGFTEDGSNNLAVYRNSGNLIFHRIDDPTFGKVSSGYAGWGDFDNDNDLDILVTGLMDNDVPTLFILRNDINSSNSKPTKPESLSIVMTSSNSFDMSWEPSTDHQTSQASLTYNIAIDYGCENNRLLDSFSAENGWRKIVEHGNAGLNTKWSFKDFDDGRYRIRVQAIDGGYLGSEFSDEEFVYIGVPTEPVELRACREVSTIKLSWENTAINEKGIVIERSFQHEEFEVIDTVSYCATNYVDIFHEDGFYQYRIRAINPNGISPFSNIASLEVNEVTLDLGDDIVLCNVDQFHIEVNDDFDSYQWSTGATNNSISVSRSGIYWVDVSLGCGIMRDSISVTLEDQPIINLGPDRAYCSGQNFMLSPGVFSSYRWHDNSTAPVFAVDKEGVYWVEVTNQCGTASDTIQFYNGLLDSRSVFIPNYFSPNSDSFNEYFKIDETLRGSKLLLYNRWGKSIRVFESYQNDWDGDDLPSGIYFFWIVSIDQCNSVNNFKGSLTLMR